MPEHLALDPALRGWVFIPLTLCIVLMKLIQQYAHMLMNGAPPKNNKEAKELREMSAVARSQRLRQFWRFIPESSYRMRKEYFVGKVRWPPHRSWMQGCARASPML